MIVTENIFITTSQLVKPILGVFLTGLLSVIIKLYENYHDKNTHIKFLKINFPVINQFVRGIQNYKRSAIIYSFLFFFLGLIFGILFEIIVVLVVGDVLDEILNIDSIAALILHILNTQNVSVIDLNMFIFFGSVLNITSFFFLFFIFVKFRKLINLRGYLVPILIKDSLLKPSIINVYALYSAFIGIPIGMMLLLYSLFISNLGKIQLIEDKVSFNFLYFNNLYDILKTNVLFLDFYFCMQLFGLILGLIIAIDAYYNSNSISNKVIRAITNFYRCDFPYIKITTNNGETKGKLKDIKNRSFVTLSENNILKIVKWNKIEIMEIIHINKAEQFIFDYSSKKDK